MKALSRWARAAVSGDVMKYALPAYSLPFVDLGLAAAGVSVLAGPWFWLFAPAAGLHALLTVSAASRSAAAPPATPASGPAGEAPPDLARLEASLEAGFTALQAVTGVKAAQDLAYEYVQLQPLLGRKRLTDSISINQIPVLATETYRQGLSVLQDALDLMQATSKGDRDRLDAEVADLEKEIATLQADLAQAPRLKLRQEQLASDNELLGIMTKQGERVDELLFQADKCSSSLHRTRMELAGLRAETSDEGVSAVLDTLKLTISHARGVQDEMKKLGVRSPRVS